MLGPGRLVSIDRLSARLNLACDDSNWSGRNSDRSGLVTGRSGLDADSSSSSSAVWKSRRLFIAEFRFSEIVSSKSFVAS